MYRGVSNYLISIFGGLLTGVTRSCSFLIKSLCLHINILMQAKTLKLTHLQESSLEQKSKVTNCSEPCNGSNLARLEEPSGRQSDQSDQVRLLVFNIADMSCPALHHTTPHYAQKCFNIIFSPAEQMFDQPQL